jgi:hypothetical protein
VILVHTRRRVVTAGFLITVSLHNVHMEWNYGSEMRGKIAVGHKKRLPDGAGRSAARTVRACGLNGPRAQNILGFRVSYRIC